MRAPYDHPVGLRFGPEDLGLVRLYLRNMVERKQSDFLTTLDVYQADPWLLPHVSNPLFKKKEWYYFVPRTKRHRNKPRRTVPPRGGSEGGYWRSGVKKVDVVDENKFVMGHKQPLTYHSIVHGKDVKTGWLMTEYLLPKPDNEFQDLVLCHIRDKTKTKVDKIVNQFPRTQPQLAHTTNNILANQLVQEAGFTGFADEPETIMLEGQEDLDTKEEADLTSFADELDMPMQMLKGEKDRVVQLKQQKLYEDMLIFSPTQSGDNNNDDTVNMMSIQLADHLIGFGDKLKTMRLGRQEECDVTQHQQKQLEEEIPIIPPTMQNNNTNDDMMAWNQKVSDIEEFLMKDTEGEDDVTEQQQEICELLQPIYQAQEDWGQLVDQDDTMMMIDNPNNALTLGNYELIDRTT
ncbi:NAC domain-containing protein 6 [Capsella rubella]|uniref:NAC domain-containing protein 6 n=1 Tax=Capsella rubella TaxID=81985 RepID=UPI000CD4B2CB|nr:NAC domain-containing protein 6 [Capsella rubella]